MPNSIKYSTGSESLALKKGNFFIGTGDVGKGPSDTTGYLNGITPATGGYVIYLNRSGAPGDLAYHNAPTDGELISFTNSLAGETFTTVNQCLTYYATQTDRVCVNRDYEPIVTDGLVLNVDAGFTPSYPRSGTTFYNTSGSYNGTLNNGPTFNTDNGGSIVYDGVDDYMNVPYNSNLSLVNSHTLEAWFYPISSPSGQGTLLRAGQGADLQYCQFYQPANQSVNYHWFDGQFKGVSSLGNVVSFNGWFLFSAVKNLTNLKLYVNGELSVDTTITNSTNNSFGSINIGNTIGNGFQKYNGRISISRIYNRALTAAEILQNYNAQKGRFGL